MTVRKHGWKLAIVAAVGLLAGCAGGNAGQVAQVVGAGTSMPSAETGSMMPSAMTLQRPAEAQGPFKVVSVIDGQTFTITRNGEDEKIHAIGLQAPEETTGATAECFGTEAGAHAQELLADREVWLETDPSLDPQDPEGRTLAYVWLSDTEMFDVQMLKDGFGMASTYHDATFPYQQAFDEAQREAQDSERGLWAADACGTGMGDETTDESAEPSVEQPEPSPQGTM